MGFSKTQIGAVVKLFGFWATVGGTIAGGIAMIRLGIVRSLWIFGIFQALSTAGFALLATIGPSVAALSAVIAFENLSSGMGTSAYAAYMASITDKRFTATQYALLTSLMGIPRVLASAPTGYLATQMGWPLFFILCNPDRPSGAAIIGAHPDRPPVIAGARQCIRMASCIFFIPGYGRINSFSIRSPKPMTDSNSQVEKHVSTDPATG